MEEKKDLFLKRGKCGISVITFAIKEDKAEGLHLINDILEGVVFEPAILVQNKCDLRGKNESDKLNKESAIHGSGGVDTKTFHIKVIFEVVKVLFNGIFQSVDLQGFDRVLDIVGNENKEASGLFLNLSMASWL